MLQYGIFLTMVKWCPCSANSHSWVNMHWFLCHPRSCKFWKVQVTTGTPLSYCQQPHSPLHACHIPLCITTDPFLTSSENSQTIFKALVNSQELTASTWSQMHIQLFMHHESAPLPCNPMSRLSSRIWSSMESMVLWTPQQIGYYPSYTHRKRTEPSKFVLMWRTSILC